MDHSRLLPQANLSAGKKTPPSSVICFSSSKDDSSQAVASEQTLGSRKNAVVLLFNILTLCAVLGSLVAMTYSSTSSTLTNNGNNARFRLWQGSTSTCDTCKNILQSEDCQQKILFDKKKSKFSDPVVILISSDGFRWEYQYKVPTPNIDRLRDTGTAPSQGLVPVYPSVTFPNHYSIATGLYPASHGIIANEFADPKNHSRIFTMASKEPDWWLGEPIWETAVKQGKKAATYFWPGSEVERDVWKCPEEFCKHYNGSVPFEERVDKILEWIDLPHGQRPSILTLYFEEPDHTGHQFGPDAPQIDAAITRIDAMIGRLLDGLDARGVFDDVHIILLGDHGMVGNCAAKEIFIEDFKPWTPSITPKWISTYFPLLAILPPPDVRPEDVYKGMTEALKSGNVANGEFLSLYMKSDLPSRFNYSNSDRIQPILGVVAEGYAVKFHKSGSCEGRCFGSHGYDNALLSMRTIFLARGPRFATNRKVSAFQNIEVYNLISDIIGVVPSSNNGSSTFASDMLSFASSK